MLKLLSYENAVLNTDDFYIKEMADGLDELIFNISIYDENYNKIIEESVIEYEQPYLVKAIDAGASTAKVKCQIDLDDLKASMLVGYSNNSDTLSGTITDVLPDGWMFVNHTGSTIRRTIEGNYTPYDVISACMETYNVVMRYDVKNKQVHAYSLDDFQPLGAFASRELNLTEINFKGKSTNFYTRLYAYGKDGLSFADINDGKPYVENLQYSNKIICAYWEDNRYTDMENLLLDAQATVDAAAVPERSYECSVYDLAQTNPEMYGFQDFSLFSVIRLIDDIKGISVNYQIVQYERYPYYPEKNVVTLSSVAPKIQNTVQNIQNQISNPSSPFRQTLQNAIDSATGWLTGVEGGYIIFNLNDEGQPFEMLIMDTPDIATAKNVWRFNQNGWGHSSNGYNGPYTTAATIDGGFVADFITAGTLQGIEIIAELGRIAGWNINSQAIYKDITASDGTIYRVYFQPPIQSNPDKTWVLSCQKSTNNGQSFTGTFVLYSDGSAKFGNTTIDTDGFVTISVGNKIVSINDGGVSIKNGNNVVAAIRADVNGAYGEVVANNAQFTDNASGIFQTSDGKTVTISNGIVKTIN